MSEQKIIRRGLISAVYPERHTARVTFEDEDNLVSAELPILTLYAAENNFYHIPAIDEQVFCLYEENDAGSGEGVILGSIYSDVNKPKINSKDKTRIDFADGSYMEFDKSSGDLEIHCTGEIKINGKKIYLN